MPDTPTPLDLRSHDLAADKRDELLRLFPEVRTEGGQIDFERLKLALGEMVDTGRERYGLTWPGKADCFRAIQAPSMGTLRPAPGESINFDTTENLIIEGDNLEVLKLLQKSYLGKIKMIYIDPPYNTGNDFIYPDNFSESLQTYLQYTGQVDAEGKKFSTNTDTDGRFHSRWLNMMYPRLYLARNLLREDGVIFISIDDTELSNLRQICDSIFGEENFICNVVWQKRYVANATAQHVSDMHDHIVVYARSAEDLEFGLLARTEEQLEDYKNPDNDPRGPWRAQDLSASKPYQAGRYEITGPKGTVFSPPPGRYWRCNKETFDTWLADARIWFGKGQAGRPMLKSFLSEAQEGLRPTTWWGHDFAGHNKEATLEIKELFDGESPFDTPKPSKLIGRALGLLLDREGVALDFFAGSGTTAHAVLDLNKQDGGNRKFILVQLPEPTGREDYPTIAEITKERVRRVIQRIARGAAENAEKEKKTDLFAAPAPSAAPREPDLGFRVYKLAESNFTTWDAQVATPAELAGQLTAHVDHLRAGRSEHDLLSEIILKAGLPLTAPVETLDVAGLPAHLVNGGELLVCLSRALTLEAVRAIAALAPERVVCLDAGLQDNDQLKANAVQLFKAKNIAFRTA